MGRATSKYDYTDARKDYISGYGSCRAVAEKYGIPYNTLVKVATKERWTDLRIKSVQKSTNEMVKKTAEKAARRIDKIQTAADLLADKILEGIKSDRYTLDAQSVNAIINALNKLKDVKGIKDDLDIQEQMARIDKLRRDARDDDMSREIKVVLSSEAEEYAK